MTTQKIYQLKITLLDAEPSIWRSIQIKSGTLLPDFHKIIQTTMGWTNSHLHLFNHNGTTYSAPDPMNTLPDKDYSNIRLDDLLKKTGDHLIYEYDFGDGWRHEIILESILEENEKQAYPVCIDGRNACPPEDCGGVWGYMDLVEIMKDPEHEEYEEMVEWLGGKFDPEAFDKKEVNKMLKSKGYGVVGF